MKRLAIALTCVLLAACERPAEDATVDTQAAQPAAPDTAATNASARALVDRFYATQASGDHMVMDSLLHSSVVFVSPQGIDDHNERLEHYSKGRIKSGPVDHQILHVQSFNDDFALVQVRAEGSGDSHGQKWAPAIMLFGLARTAGRPWEIVYVQTVHVAETASTQ